MLLLLHHNLTVVSFRTVRGKKITSRLYIELRSISIEAECFMKLKLILFLNSIFSRIHISDEDFDIMVNCDVVGNLRATD